ncbi:MAG: pentapeptide repeat-containing protein [Segetibacter sp.]|nr:pentapeptide repeat-containing protein [Segetibacter sp.]
MADFKHLDILKQGVNTWNKWRKDNPEIIPDLSSSDLTALNLTAANFTNTNFDNAILTR